MASAHKKDDGGGRNGAVAILGIGQMGLVCAGVLGGKEGLDIRMWGHSAEEAGALAQTRRSDRLPGFRLSDGVRVVLGGEGREAVEGAGVIVSAIPVQFMRSVWERMGPLVEDGAAAVSVAKGIENGTLLRPTEIMAETLGEGRGRRLAVLAGPTIAGELARCLPATMLAASEDAALAAQLQQLFSTNWLRIYTHRDVVGVELAGAVKNVIAIAAGIIDGLGAGYNAKSALLARGLAEIVRLGTAMGASPETFFGIAGVGDLATSCFSPEGRNRSCGEALGRGEKLADYLKRTPFVVEGVATARSVVDMAQRLGVELPIAEGVNAVLFEGVDPIDAIGRLMSRELKSERVG